MPTIERFEDIVAWQKGRELCQFVYQVSKQHSFKQDYGLRNQIQRASVSIMSNIAEGFESQNNRTFLRYLYIARASAAEVRAQAYVALDQTYVTEEEFQQLYDVSKAVTRLLTSFIAYLNKTDHHPNR